MLIGFGIWLGSFLFSVDGPLYSEDGFKTNLYTEFLSILVTVGLLNYLAKRRERQQEESQIKKYLLSKVRSKVHHEAIRGIEEIRDHGWLEGVNGILQQERLVQADLHNAKLSRANLNRTDLRNCNLQKVSFWDATLIDADISYANLERAALVLANLTSTNLQRANLSNTNLKGANLSNADCRHCDFTSAI